MKNIYIEHSYLVNEDNWGKIKKFFSDHPDFKFVASDWNLIEISQATDKAQARRRVDFIESLNPIWVIIKPEIQKLEVKSFLYRNLYGSEEPYSVFTDQFHKTVALAIGREPEGGWKLWGFVEHYIDHPDSLAPIQAEKPRYIQSFQKLVGVSKKNLKKKDMEIFSEWIKDVFPDKKPDGSALNDADKQYAIDFCLNDISKFLGECPYFNFENTLFDIRHSDKTRPPKESDAIDLEHDCCSVPYCDVVVIGDKHLRHIADIANKSLKMAKIVSCVSEI